MSMRTPKRELIQILLEMLSTDVMELTNQPALEQAPSVLDVIDMRFAIDVREPVVDRLMEPELGQEAQTASFVAVDALHFTESSQANAVDLSLGQAIENDHAQGSMIAGYDNQHILGLILDVASSPAAIGLDDRLVDFDIALNDDTQIALNDDTQHLALNGPSNASSHVPSGFVGDAEFALELLGGNAFRRVAHEPDCHHPAG